MGFKENILKWVRTSSPWVAHFNSGSCNGCDIEILAAITPRYDVERFGILLKGSPRHADVLIVTGPVTKQAEERLIRVWNSMPEPKFCIAVGTCTSSGSVFRDSYNHNNGLEGIIPVDVYIPGCPPKPEAIIHGVAMLLEKIKNPKVAEKSE